MNIKARTLPLVSKYLRYEIGMTHVMVLKAE